jgi:hypothetical protein
VPEVYNRTFVASLRAKYALSGGPRCEGKAQCLAPMRSLREGVREAGKIRGNEAEGAGVQTLRSSLGSEASRKPWPRDAAHTGVGSSSTEADACSFSQSDQIDYDNVSRLSRDSSYDLCCRRFNANSYEQRYGSVYGFWNDYGNSFK